MYGPLGEEHTGRVGIGYALFGVALLAWKISLIRWEASLLAKGGLPTRGAWRRLPRSGITWIAVIAIVSSFSPMGAGVLMAGVFVVSVAFVVLLLVRGVRGLPEFARQVRRIGDPAAWRGDRAAE
jgi:hypothetical protein